MNVIEVFGSDSVLYFFGNGTCKCNITLFGDAFELLVDLRFDCISYINGLNGVLNCLNCFLGDLVYCLTEFFDFRVEERGD